MKRKFAIPYSDNQLSKHFGKTEYFKIIETENKSITSSSVINAPELKHGQLPQ